MDISIKEWTDIVVAAAAVAAIIVSLVSLLVSSRALRLTEMQEERKKPRLISKLLDSYFEDAPDGNRIYSFWISVGNPTDTDNAIAQIEIHLSYKLYGSVSITVKLPAMIVGKLTKDEYPQLITPSQVTAHNTVSGWCGFVVHPGVANEHAIEGYQIVLTDSHQAETKVDAIVVSERRHAT